MASTGESGLSTLRSTQMRCRSSLGMQQLFLARARALNVDGREDALVDQLAVEDDFHVAGALELFEDHVVHAGAGIDQRGGDDGERAAFFDVAGRAEEALGRCRALESTPPESTLPEGGTMVL